MLYAPLKLIDQMENYFVIPNARNMEEKINADALNWVKLRLAKDGWKKQFIRDYVLSRETLVMFAKFPSEIRNFWRSEKSDFAMSLSGLIFNESDEDFFNEILLSVLYEEWRYHKLVYKIDKYMIKQFSTMKHPDTMLLSCIFNLPSDCFYVDMSEYGECICKGFEGFFLTTSLEKDVDMCIQITTLIRGRDGRVMPVFTQSYMNLQNGVVSDRCQFINHEVGVREIDMEDGGHISFNEGMLYNICINFLIYLQAANKDVQVSEVSKKTVSKPVDKSIKPKNKFKEVRQYEVGYRISSDIKKKYVGGSSDKGKGRGTAKSSHFRSAHWHHFWTGSGENKKLIIKWVEGVWVNGKSEQDVAVVHKVHK